jgi:hypothetical protein
VGQQFPDQLLLILVGSRNKIVGYSIGFGRPGDIMDIEIGHGGTYNFASFVHHGMMYEGNV